MKNNKLQTKRKTQKGFRAMYARTVGKKVKASAAASADELDGDVPSVGIGKALTVILILHVLAIAAIYVGTQWRDDDGNGNGKGKSNAIVHDVDDKSSKETSQSNNNNAGTVYVPAPGSYDLENNNAQRNTANADNLNTRPSGNDGLAVEPQRRRPRIIKPRRNPNKPQPMNNPTESSYVNYEIKKGDNFYRLAKRYNLKQQELIDMNPSVNTRKMKLGMIVKIPKN